MNQTLGPYELNTIITGNARELAKEVPDESVDLIFTDPIYWQIDDYLWLALLAQRVLKEGASVLAFVGHAQTAQAQAAMLISGLKPGPVLEHYVAGSVGRLFSHSVQCNVLPCLWFSKGNPNNQWQALQEASKVGVGENRTHKWGKAEMMALYRIGKFTQAGGIVLDPFCGGGTIPKASKMLQRNFLAFELNPETAQAAREKIMAERVYTLPSNNGLQATPNLGSNSGVMSQQKLFK